MIARVRRPVAIGLDVRRRAAGSPDGEGWTLSARGWTRDGGDLFDVLGRLDAAGCARYVVTDISRDGTLTGPGLDVLRAVCARTDAPVIASGGVSTWTICGRWPHSNRSASRVSSPGSRSTWARSPSRRRCDAGLGGRGMTGLVGGASSAAGPAVRGKTLYGYARVVRTDGLAFVSGCTATVDGAVVGVGDAAAQARTAFGIALDALERSRIPPRTSSAPGCM